MHPNRVKYIVAQYADSYPKIAQEFGLGIWQLYKYNDFAAQKDQLSTGDIVYLQPKRKYSRISEVLIISEPLSLLSISQREAINIKSLLHMNNHITNVNQIVKKGDKIVLR